MYIMEGHDSLFYTSTIYHRGSFIHMLLYFTMIHSLHLLLLVQLIHSLFMSLSVCLISSILENHDFTASSIVNPVPT